MDISQGNKFSVELRTIKMNRKDYDAIDKAGYWAEQ